jgi:hypothetical protein
MADTNPFTQLDPAGKPAIISYNVPEPTSYSGENLIELQFEASIFSPAALQKPPSDFDNADTI